MSDPITLAADMNADAVALSQASEELRSLTDRLVDAEIAYADAMDQALATVEEEYRQRGEKLPSERQREAHARPRIEPKVRREFLTLERRVKHIQAWGEVRGRALSARQTQAKLLRDEAQAPVAQPSWGGPRRAA